MSRVAVRPSNSDDIEKILPAILAAGKLAVGALGRGAVQAAGKTALGQGITAARGATGVMGKLKAGAKAFGQAKVKDATKGEDGETDGAAVAAKLAQQTMANQAQARQNRLQNQKEHNMQMADRAKQNSQIAAGEPMDMSWRLLKDWSWSHELSPRARRAIVERARKAKKKQQYSHIHPVPSRHHDDQFAERYHPHQKMPQDAIGLEPHEIAGAMADLFLENHPELRQALEEELPHPADPNQTNTPGMVFHALTTDNPKISDNTSWNTYSPVIAKPNMFAKPMVHTAVNSPISQASNRHTIRVSTVQDYPHSHARHNEILPSKFNLVDPLSGLPVSRGEAEKLRQDYRIRQLGGSEEKWRDKISTVEDERQNKVEQDVISRLATEASNIQQRDAKQAKQFEAQQAREQRLAAKEQGELKVEAGPMPGIYYVTDPAFGLREEMIMQGNPNVGQGYDYYHNHYQNQQTVQTGEPMDLAWRLLKREIHPGSIAAYRQMVEDLGDDMPVEQRIAQLLGEGKYLNHPKQFELHPARPTKQYDYHGNVENLEDVPILNEKLEPFKITDDGYPEHRNLSIYDKHNLSPKRVTYTPEILEREELPTFAGIPFNEETGFTRSEPMDLAMRMLKQMSDEEMQEWAYENLRNQGITIPDEREEEVVPKPEIPTLYY